MNLAAKTIVPAAALALALLAPAVQAQKAPGHMDMDMKPMMQKHSEMMKSMPMTGKPDVDFAAMMREHHKHGIEMAQWQIDHGSDPRMKDMARKMIAEQKKDVAELDRFLASSGQKGATGAMGASGQPSNGKSSSK